MEINGLKESTAGNRPQLENDELASSLSLEVNTDFESLASIREEWDCFVEEVGGNLYGTFDWCRIWWKYYGKGRRLRIFIVRDRGNLVALLPMFIDDIWFGPILFRVAKLVGSDLPPTLCWPAVLHSKSDEVFRLLLVRMTAPGDCDAVVFSPLSGICPLSESLLNCCTDTRQYFVVSNAEGEKHSLFSLPDTYEIYLQSLNKKQRGNCRRERRLIEGTFDIQLDVIREFNEAEKEFGLFLDMHNIQWHSQGKRGHFGAWPKAESFNREMVQIQSKLGRLRLIRMSADGIPISYQYLFAFGNCYYWRLPARQIDEEWTRYSLGRIGLATLIETAISEGIKYIEAGIGQYEYKVQLGGEEYPTRSIIFLRNNTGARLRYRLFQFCANLLNILYHKIWYMRLSLRLPLKRGKVWQIWIRSRL